MKPLSKTEFVRGLDCSRRVWLDRNRLDLKPPLSVAVRERIATGGLIGRLAQKLYPNGAFVRNPEHTYQTGHEQTQAMIADGHDCLFEATCLSGEMLARLDILWRIHGKGWTIDEVKSSTVREPEDLTDDKVFDLAYQVLVAKQAGIDVERARLVLVDSGYVWQGGEFIPSEMLGAVDLTEQCLALEEDVTTRVSWLIEILGQDVEPVVETNTHCLRCDYFEHCFASRPKYDLVHFPRIKPESVVNLRLKGYQAIDEIPDTEKLSPPRKRMRDVIVNGVPFVSDGLHEVIEAIPFPAAFIDYETSNPAFPSYPGTRPYQQICFQWSAHLLESPSSTPVHREFLPTDGTDPRAEFCRTLWETVKGAASLVHYTGFEIRELKQMADEGIPLASQLLDLITKRTVDLHKIISEHVLFEGFMGKTSIKVVLPTLVPAMTYSDLLIGDGTAAATGYRKMVAPGTSTEERAQLRRALLDYCCQDTLAMVEIYRALGDLSAV